MPKPKPIYKETRYVTTPDGRRERRQSKAWFIRWTDGQGRRRKMKAAPTFALAKEILLKKLAEAAAERAGLPRQSVGDVRLDALLGAYVEAQTGRVTPRHLRETESVIRRALEAMGAWRVRDVTREKVQAYISRRREAGASPRTCNVDLVRLKGFLNWAVRAEELPVNPIASVRAMPEREKRHARRALSPEEIGRLVAATEGAPWLKLGVLLAAFAGLRLGEIRALLWSDIDLGAGSIRIRPEIEKTRRGAVLPIHPALKAELERQRNPLPGPGARVVPGMPSNPVRPLRRALERAGIPYRDDSGRFADWHALRHSFLTNLVRAGATMKEVQSLGRHATAAVTLGIYLHSDRGREAAAVTRLPFVEISPEVEGEALPGA